MAILITEQEVCSGVFGNPFEWIAAAIDRALALFKDSDLDVAIVSFGSSKAGVRDLVNCR